METCPGKEDTLLALWEVAAEAAPTSAPIPLPEATVCGYAGWVGVGSPLSPLSLKILQPEDRSTEGDTPSRDCPAPGGPSNEAAWA